MSWPIVYQGGFVVPQCARTNYVPTNPRVGPPGAAVVWNSTTGLSTLVPSNKQPQSATSWTLPSSAGSKYVPTISTEKVAAFLTLSSNARVAPPPHTVVPLAQPLKLPKGPVVYNNPACQPTSLTTNCSNVILPRKLPTSCTYPFQ